jgi:hypothetical protein
LLKLRNTSISPIRDWGRSCPCPICAYESSKMLKSVFNIPNVKIIMDNETASNIQ